jgi:septal ring factor EnvC (AmiA/AmiB activator)
MSAQWTAWLAGAMVIAVTLGASHVWHRRRLVDALRRLEKIDRARAAAEQRATQARKQIDQLQKELAAQHRARIEALAAQRRAPTIPQVPNRLERELARSLAEERHDAALPPNGFADTMPM